jgi:hypothetical protein
MAFFADLSPHTYAPTSGLEIVNVGWLDEGNNFPTGESPREFQEALLELCKDPVFLHRGTHACWFCRALHRQVEGNGQIRVSSNHVWYAAPTLVHHYVVAHGYLPPREFIEAVMLKQQANAKTMAAWRF